MKKYIEELKEFVAIKSVSTDPEFKEDIEKAAQWLIRYTKNAGFSTKLVRGFGNPIVIVKTPYKKGRNTFLVYGHYDVQPAERGDGWRTDPFILSTKNQRLYGRGSADNKGQILMHLYSVRELQREGKLNANVIFLIEGNEETGSSDLRKFIGKYKKELRADAVIISDGELGRNNAPALEASFRGVANIEVTLRTAEDDVHSGLFGGVTANAAEELSRILGQISGFIGKKIIPASQAKRYETKRGLHPTIEVTGLFAGYIGTGFRNSIPSKVTAKINIRSAPEQDPEKIVGDFKKFVNINTKKHSRIEFGPAESSRGALLDLNNPFSLRAQKILREVYKQKPVIKNSGGTLPIVNDFRDILGIPQVMVPLANEDCGMHSASENITVEAVKNGLAFSSRFFSKD